MKAVRVGNFFGGLPIKTHRELVADKDKCPHVLVGTPGRIKAVRRGEQRGGGEWWECGAAGPPPARRPGAS